MGSKKRKKIKNITPPSPEPALTPIQPLEQGTKVYTRVRRKGRKRSGLLKIILVWQGLYYLGTGIWAFIALNNFTRVTGDAGDAFDKRSIAALSLVLGVAFIRGAMKNKYVNFAAWLLLGSTLAVIITELMYFSEVWGTLFILDLLEEIFVLAIATFALMKYRGIIR